MLKDWDFRLPRLPITQWLIIALIVISVGLLVHEVINLKQQIRQANYAAVVSNIRAAMIERWVETQGLPRQKGLTQPIAGAEQPTVFRLALFNPMRLLKQVPENYLGALDKAPSHAEDVWFFNIKKNCLVYVDASGKQTLHPLVKGSVTRGMLGGWDIHPIQHAH